MELKHNPKYLGDRKQVWKSFLIGSLITSSIIYLILTENVIVFFSALGLILIGVILFIDNILSLGKIVYLSHNLFFFAIGLIVTIIFHVNGFLLLYMWIVVILVIVTWLHKFRLMSKIKTSS